MTQRVAVARQALRRGITIEGMVSDEDRAHFRRIAEAMERVNREELARDARRPPGEKIEAALRLSRHVPPASARGRRLGPEPVAPIALWLRLGKGRAGE